MCELCDGAPALTNGFAERDPSGEAIRPSRGPVIGSRPRRRQRERKRACRRRERELGLESVLLPLGSGIEVSRRRQAV
jgi:hypothetical protein